MFQLMTLPLFQVSLLYNNMGCTPPEKRNISIPAVNSAPINLTHKYSHHSKNSTPNNQINALQVPIPQFQSHPILKPKKSTTQKTNLQKFASLGNLQKFSYEHRVSPDKQLEKQVIRIISPSQKVKSPNKSTEKLDTSKITSIHSLDLVSKIKSPKENQAKPDEGGPVKEHKNSKVEQINITFNNNDFVVAESKTSGRFGRRKQKEQALINQLKSMNNQNFKRININSRNFN